VKRLDCRLCGEPGVDDRALLLRYSDGCAAATRLSRAAVSGSGPLADQATALLEPFEQIEPGFHDAVHGRPGGMPPAKEWLAAWIGRADRLSKQIADQPKKTSAPKKRKR